MAQKVTGYIKLRIPAAKATASPCSPGTGQHGVNISQFIKEFNERTTSGWFLRSPSSSFTYADRSFVTKTSDPDLILKHLGIENGLAP